MHYVEKVIKSKLDSGVYDLLKDTGCILAGGALTSLYSGAEVNDWDIYLTQENALGRIVSEVYGQSSHEYLDGFDLRANMTTDRSFMTMQKDGSTKVQFIHYQLYDSPESVFKAFDFTINMAAYDFASEKIVLHPHFLEAVAARRLVVNPYTHYPLVSALRVQKYKDRGYTISKAEMLRVLFSVANKQYDSWETVIHEIGGMYGVAPKDLFDQTKPFSIDEVIEQLSTVSLREKFDHAESLCFEEVVGKLQGSLDKNFMNYFNAACPKYYYGSYDDYDYEKVYDDCPERKVHERKSFGW